MEVLEIGAKLAAGEISQVAPKAIQSEMQTQAKFVVTPKEAKRLLQSKALKRRTQRKALTSLEQATYYDTPRFLLKKNDLTLCLRQTGKQVVQTIKAGRNFTAGTLMRWEITKTLKGDNPDLEMVRQVLPEPTLSTSALRRLTPVFSTNVRRIKLELEVGNTHFILAYDQGDVSHPDSGKVLEKISEIEVELKTGSARDMFALLCELNETCTWQQIGVSKAERGYAAISRSHAFRPRKHKEFVSKTGIDSFGVMQSAMSSALAHFFANNPNLLADKPEAIHQTRVAVRRMRAILHSCKSIVSYMDRKALNGELRWLQTKLGESRDWHVLRHDTLPKMKVLTSDQRAEVNQLARKAHANLLPKALDIYNSRRAQRLILHIQYWLAGLPAEGGPDVEEVGRTAMGSNIRRLHRLGRLTTRKPISDIHAIRIKSKKIRYTLEILPSSDQGADKEVLKSLTSLQEKLGDLNDIAKCLELTGTLRASELSLRTREKIRVWAETEINELIAPARVHYNAILRWDPKIN